MQFLKDNLQELELHIIVHSLGNVIIGNTLFSDRFEKTNPAFQIRALIQNFGVAFKTPIRPPIGLKSLITLEAPIVWFNTMLGISPDRSWEFAKRCDRTEFRCSI